MPNENKHSVLSPSSKEWVHCGYSAKFLATKEEETNDASEFGTECHALVEAYIKQSLKIEDFDEKPASIDELKSSFKHYDEEMETFATGYSNFVIGQADYEKKRTGKGPLSSWKDMNVDTHLIETLEKRLMQDTQIITLA